MNSKQAAKIMGAVAAMVAVLLAGMLSNSPRVQAQDSNNQGNDGQGNDNNGQALVQIGFRIAPVPLNLPGKDRNLVGLGSFLVNAVADCDGCHSAGQNPNFNYASGFNPYFGQHPAKIDPTTYLAGGTDFGTAIFGPGYQGPNIISRNLTPDKTGRPDGGSTLQQFIQIIRTGVDPDHLHPTCTSTSPTPTPANCIPPPVDGNLLQVMPWPVFQYMTDHDLQAIYEYLSAIPCLPSGPGAPPQSCH